MDLTLLLKGGQAAELVLGVENLIQKLPEDLGLSIGYGPTAIELAVEMLQKPAKESGDPFFGELNEKQSMLGRDRAFALDAIGAVHGDRPLTLGNRVR